jgi:hypothetical protein
MHGLALSFVAFAEVPTVLAAEVLAPQEFIDLYHLGSESPSVSKRSIRPLLLLFPDRDGGVTGTTKIGREAKLLGNFFFVGRIVDVAMLLGICYMS